MATSNVKRAVHEAIASALASGVAGLANRVSALQEGPEKVAEFPSASLIPSVYTFEPMDYDEIFWDEDTDDGKLVISVGEFTGISEIQLYAKSKPERELYEQRILDFFLSQEGSPGTLMLTLPTITINGSVELAGSEIKVRLMTAEWQEEFAFESRRYSFLDLDVSYSALTTRDANTIETLIVALNEDLDSDDPLESVTVDEDGSVS